MRKSFKNLVVASLLALSSYASAGEKLTIPEGTEVRLRLSEKLVSGTAVEGSRFNLELDEAVSIGGQVVIPAGAKAVGTVMSSKKKGFMGKGGELNVMLDYVLVNDQRIRLRAAKASEGQNKMGATVALTVLFGPIGLLKRGHNIEMNPGSIIPAFVDQSTEVTF